LKSLERNDLVYLHVEAPDEAGHEGNFELKVKTIEDLDKRVIGRIMNRMEDDYVISVVSDHFTPVKLRTHTTDPAPFAIYNSKRGQGDQVKRYDEFEVQNGSHGVIEAKSFLSLVLKG
jgi:2,3-bisphosphoglycerate-independent phosphoglycerate mutase